MSEYMQVRNLTDREMAVIQRLVEAWNVYITLPQLRPHHLNDFQRYIHEAQRIVMCRPISEAINNDGVDNDSECT